MTLSRFVTLSFPSLSNFDIEAKKFYDRAHQLYEPALLTRCYARPYIDAEIILCILLKLNLSTINLPSIFNYKSVISSIPTYFENKESPKI